jgi:hypothetical protein
MLAVMSGCGLRRYTSDPNRLVCYRKSGCPEDLAVHLGEKALVVDVPAQAGRKFAFREVDRHCSVDHGC